MFGSRKIKLLSFTLLITLSVGAFSLSALEPTPKQDFTNLASFYNNTTYFPSNRYTGVDDLRPTPNLLTINPEIDQYVTTIETGEVYVNPSDLSFKVKNQVTGYIWGSTINVEGQRLSTMWKGKVRSAVVINYFNPKNAIMEESLLLSPETKIDFQLLKDGYQADITFGTSKIQLTLVVTFDDYGVNVSIPASSILDGPEAKLASLKLYSFFGAVKGNEIPGYMFIPDGVGALVRYDDIPLPLAAPNNYYKEIYDKDLSYVEKSDLSTYQMDGSKIYVPVYGFVHGIDQNAVFAMIHEGAEFAAINAYQAGRVTDFYTVFPEFIYRKMYRQPVNARGDTIALLQNERNDFDINVHYEFLSDENANYLGMAKYYQSYLNDQQVLTKQTTTSTDTPLRLEVIMQEKKPGTFFDDTIVMTTFEQYQAMLDDLQNEGLDSILTVLKGYTTLGYSYSSPSYDSIAGNLGSISELASLENTYFHMETMKATNKVGNYNPYDDLAKKISDQIYEFSNMNHQDFLLKPESIQRILKQNMQSLSKSGAEHFALDTIGSLLYSNYAGEKQHRNDVVDYYQAMLLATNQKFALYDSNDYLFSYMDSYFDIPMYNSQYMMFDDTVPFLTIVLKGYMDLYAPYANFFPSAKDELLRMIDFGVFPSFIITEESSHYLLETDLYNIYSSRYVDLKDAIVTYYDYINEALRDVIDASIVQRKVLQEGVVKVTYDNDTFLIINYTNQDVVIDTLTILEKDFIVGQVNV